MKTMRYEFIDPDDDVLKLGLNYSFEYPSIILYAGEGVRMTIEDTEKLIEELQKLINEVKEQQ